MKTVPIYAALLALLFAALSVRTLRMRRRLRIGVGDGGNPELLRAMRAHSNFAEYVPLSLFLFYLVEQSRGGGPLIHALAGALLLGRLLHAWGVSHVNEQGAFRAAGMILTLTPMTVAAGLLLSSTWRS